MESAASNAAGNIEARKQEAEARIKAAAKYGQEKAQKRVEWLRKKAAKTGCRSGKDRGAHPSRYKKANR